MGEMTKKGFNKTQMAKELGITLKTFSNKMKTGKLGVDEAETIARLLRLDNETASKIFFAPAVTSYATKPQPIKEAEEVKKNAKNRN